jgi:hypothetical protein
MSNQKTSTLPTQTSIALTDKLIFVKTPGSNPITSLITVADFLFYAGFMDLLSFTSSASGTSHPVISATIQNDLGITISFLRTAVGTFTLQVLDILGEAIAAFTLDKTLLPNAIAHTFTEDDGSVTTRFLTFLRTNATTITIKNKYQSGDEVDGFNVQTINISVVK